MAGSYNPTTRSGYNMFEMASMLQKAIRRCDIRRAGFAAYELYGNYYTFLWKRLVVTSAEDCFGIITKEIIALKLADDQVNGAKKGYERDPLFVAKAIVLLCLARKSRDGCYVACNFMTAGDVLEPDEIKDVDISKLSLGDEGIPDWVFDVHTLVGKKRGKTEVDMGEDEQAALTPLQLGFFDHGDWSAHDNKRRESGRLSKKEDDFLKETYQHRVLDPTDIQQWHDKMISLNVQIEYHKKASERWKKLYEDQAKFLSGLKFDDGGENG